MSQTSNSNNTKRSRESDLVEEVLHSFYLECRDCGKEFSPLGASGSPNMTRVWENEDKEYTCCKGMDAEHGWRRVSVHQVGTEYAASCVEAGRVAARMERDREVIKRVWFCNACDPECLALAPHNRMWSVARDSCINFSSVSAADVYGFVVTIFHALTKCFPPADMMLEADRFRAAARDRIEFFFTLRQGSSRSRSFKLRLSANGRLE